MNLQVGHVTHASESCHKQQNLGRAQLGRQWVCCSLSVAVCCNTIQMWMSHVTDLELWTCTAQSIVIVLQCVAVFCSALRRCSVCFIELQCVAVCCRCEWVMLHRWDCEYAQQKGVCSDVLRCVAVVNESCPTGKIVDVHGSGDSVKHMKTVCGTPSYLVSTVVMCTSVAVI